MKIEFQGGATKTYTGHRGAVFCIDATRDGKTVGSGGFDGTFRIWDLSTGDPQLVILPFADGTSVTFTPAGQPLHTEGEAFQHLTYVVEKEDGALEVLSPLQFLGRVRKALKNTATEN
ncbi:MAG: WD40 repeat domain-containing protein [Planctomycetia bacterium]